MKDITTILFDIDGTLLDTREFIFQATECALKACGHVVPDRAAIAKVVGKPFPDYYLEIAGENADTDKLVKTHRDFQLENLHLSTPFPSSVEVLKKLRDKGYKLAAITTRHKITSHPTLIRSGMFDLFDTIITTDLVKNFKPHPEPLLKALGILGEVPEHAVMIGDSYIDIQAGKNAGTKTIRVTSGFHTDHLHDPEPDYIIDDISDLLKIL